MTDAPDPVRLAHFHRFGSSLDLYSPDSATQPILGYDILVDRNLLSTRFFSHGSFG